MNYPVSGWTFKGKTYICADCQQKQSDIINYNNGWWWFDTYHLDVFLTSFYCYECENLISNLV